MDTLFDLAPIFPPGFEYFPEFLSGDEEQELLKIVAGTAVQPFVFQGYTAHRKIASFGFDYNFANRKLSKGEDIPPVFGPLIRKVSLKLGIAASLFLEMLITEYPPGAVINWHRDAPPFDIIAGISLLSDCIFRLRPQEKTKHGRSSVISFPVKRRSLYVIRDIARSEWQHSIVPVKTTRYSVTLRTLRKQ